MKTAAIIVAAGKGTRAGGDATPKQYRLLGGKPVLRWSVETLLDHPGIDRVLVVISPDEEELYQDAIGALTDHEKLAPPCSGGDTRQASVHNGLKALANDAVTHVLVHDAARPGLDHALVDRLLSALEQHDGALAAMPVNDTLKRAGKDDMIEETVDRSALWAAQTPQGFAYDRLLAAHEEFRQTPVTDDAALAERAGITVQLVPGTLANMKITRADDFATVERLMGLTQMEYRTGHGFDVHAFEAGDAVILCGVEIPHEQKLRGHSDADAGMHALTDALFGALGEGDIGDHFPPSDPQWKGAASSVFLEKAASMVRARGGSITHCDITLICERPKIGPHRAAMKEALAAILDVSQDRISVKATTTEKLGFTGRGEGIAAMATASVCLLARH